MLPKFNLLFSPETIVPAAGGGDKALSKEEAITFLGMGDEKEEDQVIPLDEKKDDKKVKEDKKEEPEEEEEEVVEEEEVSEEDELKEIEESLEEEDISEEKLELVTPVSRKEILKKYPTLFKDFPHLETAFYRNYQFTELFPTLDDAREAGAKAETLDKFDADLLAGNTQNILAAAKTSDPKAFNKIVDNYLTTLAAVDKDAYTHVIGNTLKHTIMAMVKEGRRSDDDSLIEAAGLVNKFIFGSTEFDPPKKLSTDEKVDNTAEKELETKQKAFARQKFDSANDNLTKVVQNSLRATINQNIDPKKSMSDYVLKNASRDAMEQLESLISTDKQFSILVDKLWENASKNDFSKDSTDKIRNAFFAKAKTLLPAVIKKARIEALRGMGKRVSSEDKIEDKEDKVDRPKTVSRSNDKVEKGKVPQGMSTLEFLMKD